MLLTHASDAPYGSFITPMRLAEVVDHVQGIVASIRRGAVAWGKLVVPVDPCVGIHDVTRTSWMARNVA
jgi:hypothetical protein